MTPIKGTGDGGLTQQSSGFNGQRMLAFFVTILFANGTMVLAKLMSVPLELATVVIYAEVSIGAILVLGRSGVHIAEAWAQSKLGKVESRTLVESSVTQTPPKKK